MRFGLRTFAVLTTACAVALGLGTIVDAQAQETVTLRFASAFSPMSTNNKDSVPAFIDAVEKASEGTLKIEHFPGGTLGGSPVQQLSMVEAGTADIAEVVVAYTPNRFPELGVFELPFLAESNVEAGLAAYKLYEKHLLSGLDDLMLVGVIMSGPYGISTTEPIAKLADLSGKRIRAAGPIQADIVARLGAAPVGNIPAPGIAENLSRGLIGGTLMTPGNLFNFRIADAATHHNWQLALGNVGVIFPMRKETFEKLPPKAKAAFQKYSGEWFTRVLGENLDKQQKEAEEKIRADSGQTVHEWSKDDIAKARALLDPVKEKYDAENGKGINIYREIEAALKEVRAGN